MEFQYRAGDDRSRSRLPPPGAAAALDGGGAAGDPPPPAPADSDELPRQAAKDKIRKRILEEEADNWELEAEVRRELMEHLAPLLRPGLGRPAGAARADGSDEMAAPAEATKVTAAAVDSPLEAESKPNASATLPAKRKNADVTAASAVSAAAATTKKPKPNNNHLLCTVCGLQSTSLKAMHDHLMGRSHKKKAARLALAPELEEEEEEAVLRLPPPSGGGFTPTRFTMLTNAGAMSEVLQMDGYLLCEVCNVRTSDRVTMMCHLEGAKHVATAQKQLQAGVAMPLPPAAAAKKDAKNNGGFAPAAVAAGGDPETSPAVAPYGAPCIVRRADGSLLCRCCDAKLTLQSVARSHLAGQKHKKKAKAMGVASVHGVVKMEVESTATQSNARANGDGSSVSVPKLEVREVAAMAAGKAGGHGMLQVQGTGALAAGQGVVDDVPAATPRQEVKKVDAPAACPATVVIDVDDEQHVVPLVDGFLLCECCNVKAVPDSIDVMRDHLAGKKHKKNANKVAAVHAIASAGSKRAAALAAESKPQSHNEAASVVVAGVSRTNPNDTANGQAAGGVKPATTREDAASAAAAASKAAPESIKAVESAKEKDDPSVAEEEGAAASDAKGSITAEGEGSSTKTDGGGGIAAAAPGHGQQEVKIQVEGKTCAVLRGADGALSCGPCGVRARDKLGILHHLYTRAHWDKVAAVEAASGGGGEPPPMTAVDDQV